MDCVLDIFDEDLTNMNLGSLCEALLEKYRDPYIRQSAIASIISLKNIIGENHLKRYKKRLTPRNKRRLEKILTYYEEDEEMESPQSESIEFPVTIDDDADVVMDSGARNRREPSRIPRPVQQKRKNSRLLVEYGIIDEALMRMIRNQVSLFI